MASSRVQFFSMPDEFLAILQRIANSLNLIIILYRSGPRAAVEQADIGQIARQIRSFGASRLYLAEPGINLADIDPLELEPSRLGMIQVVFPRESGRILFMSEIAVKTDWIDISNRARCENPQLMTFFKRVKTELLKEDMKAPVLGINLVTGGSSIYSAIKYTRSAKEFSESGGELMQEGVNNVRFRIVVAHVK